MTTMNFEQIREELVNTLRNGNVISLAIRGMTTKTDTFTATASQTVFHLTQHPLYNVRSVTVQSVNKYLFRDYTVNWTTGDLTLNTGATLSDTVIIIYDYGGTAKQERVYSDMPRPDLDLNSFPRVGMALTSTKTMPFGIGGANHITDLLITIYAWVPVKIASSEAGVGGTSYLEGVIRLIRDTLRTNAKGFYNFQYVFPMSTSPIIKGQNDYLLQMSQDFNIKFVTELN